MATSSHYDANADFTVCPVCLDKFQTPRSLPCSHTFCHRCLSAHIESSCQDSDPAFGFPCPVCRVFVPAPGILRQYPTQDWARRFPENSFLSSCIRKQVSPSNILCGPCKILDEDGVKAVSFCVECEDSFCEKCVQRHKMFKALQPHQILPIANFGTDLVKSLEKSRKIFIGCCEKHEERNIELICDVHQKGCCSLCIVNEHKQCGKFSAFSEAADASLDETKLKRVQEIKHILSKVETIIKKEKQNIFDVDDKTDTYSEKIKNMIEEMVVGLRNFEETYLNQLAAISKDARQKLEGSIRSLEQRKMYLAHWLEVISTDARNQSKEELVTKCLNTNHVLKAVKSLPLIQVHIDLFADVSSGIEKLDSLGTLFSAKTIEKNIDYNDIQHATFVEIAEFNIPGSNIYGGGFLSNGQLLLCDNSTEKCLVYDEDGSIIQEIPLPGAPWDAYFEFDGRILVTIPDEKTIVVLQEHTLAIEKTIDLSYECGGIAKRQDRYLISTEESIEEFSSDFIHLESRVKDITDDIAVDNDGFVVFITNNATITKEDPGLNYKGIFSYEHEELVEPYGIAIDNNGFIFVNDNDSGNIHILSDDGHLLKKIDIDSPQCIKFKKSSERFFVANSEGVIKIFETTW